MHGCGGITQNQAACCVRNVFQRQIRRSRRLSATRCRSAGCVFSCPSVTPFGYAEEPLWVTDMGFSARWKTLCCELKERVPWHGRAFSAVRKEYSSRPASPLPSQKRLSGVRKDTSWRTAFSVLQKCFVNIFYRRKRIFMQRRDAFPEYFRVRLMCLFGNYPYFCPAYMISGKILN